MIKKNTERMGIIAILIGILIYIPSIFTGLNWDDYYFFQRLDMQKESLTFDFKAYHFLKGSTEEGENLKKSGFQFWFTENNQKMELLRYLPAVLFSIDYKIFKDDVIFYHVHSLFWWLLAMIMFLKVFSVFFDKKVAALALLLFVLSDANTLGVTWISNRYLVINSFFGLTSLYLLILSDTKNKNYLYLSYFVLALNFTNCEMAIGSWAMLFLYECFRPFVQRTNRPRQIKQLLAILVIYVGAYKFYGFGITSDQFYTHPLNNTLSFLLELPANFIIYIAGLLWGLPIHELFFIDENRVKTMFAGMAGLVLLAFLYLWGRKQAKDLIEQKKLNYFFSIVFLGLLPALSAPPDKRLASISLLGLIGLLAVVYGNTKQDRRAPTIFRFLFYTYAVTVFGCFSVLENSKIQKKLYQANQSMKYFINEQISKKIEPEQKLIFLSAPNALTEVVPAAYYFYKRARLNPTYTLSMSPDKQKFIVVEQNTLRLLASTEFLKSPTEKMHRRESHPLLEGMSFNMGIAAVEVKSVEQDQGYVIDFRFHEKLSSNKLMFLHIDYEDWNHAPGIQRYYISSSKPQVKIVKFNNINDEFSYEGATKN